MKLQSAWTEDHQTNRHLQSPYQVNVDSEREPTPRHDPIEAAKTLEDLRNFWRRQKARRQKHRETDKRVSHGSASASR